MKAYRRIENLLSTAADALQVAAHELVGFAAHSDVSGLAFAARAQLLAWRKVKKALETRPRHD